jgi:hypothetical protein
MSYTVPSQHPAVVLRSSYQHLRALLAIAIAIIFGLTIAVVVLATSGNHTTLATPTTASATVANPSAEIGARLDHSGRNPTVPQPSVSTYPDAPPPIVSTTQPTVSSYADAPPPSVVAARARAWSSRSDQR